MIVSAERIVLLYQFLS